MSNITLQPSGHVFQTEEGETVLTAALRQGFVLPYGCKNGACGTCKARVLTGSVDYGSYQAKALTEAEKAEGKTLLCQAKPLSDLTVEARTVGGARCTMKRASLPSRASVAGWSRSAVSGTAPAARSSAWRPGWLVTA